MINSIKYVIILIHIQIFILLRDNIMNFNLTFKTYLSSKAVPII